MIVITSQIKKRKRVRLKYIHQKKRKLSKEEKNLIEKTSPTAARYGLSATAHCAMVASTASALGPGEDIEVPSIRTVKRKRIRYFKEKANELKESFFANFSEYPKIVQWDGKIMVVENKEGREKEDINAVVISVPGTSCPPKTIGASSLKASTGANLAQSTLAKTRDWTHPDDIFAGVFDTTSNNTGLREGAMVHLERTLDKKLLWLPCRHHVAELHIKHAWTRFFPTNSPEDPLFKSFKEWFLSNKSNIAPETFRKYEWGDEDKNCEMGPFFKNENHFLNQTLLWLQRHLKANTFPRADYRELSELMNFILGGQYVPKSSLDKGFSLKKPGACHHARFMAKAIYILKMFILSHVFNKLTVRQERIICRMTIFILSLYGKYFLQSSLSTAAPRLDKQFLTDIIMYETIDQEISITVLNSVKRHMWYLAAEMIPFALFDPEVPITEKKMIALALSGKNAPSSYQIGKPVVSFDNVHDAETLHELVTEDSWFLFEKAKLFLNAVKAEHSMG